MPPMVTSSKTGMGAFSVYFTPFDWWFWTCIVAAAFYGLLFFLLMYRRNWWLWLMDVEEAFWTRFGLKKGGKTRQLGESKFFKVSTGCAFVLFLTFAAIRVGMFYYLQQRLHQHH